MLPIFSNLLKLCQPPLKSVHSSLPLFLCLVLTVFEALFISPSLSLSPTSLSFHLLSCAISPFPPQTVLWNCYSPVIILFVRLHSAVNPLGIPLYSLLTLLQSSFSCQSQKRCWWRKEEQTQRRGRSERDTRTRKGGEEKRERQTSIIGRKWQGKKKTKDTL